MFVCISANPAIDKRMRLSKLVPGHVNRVSQVQPAAGGKATHVAMVLRTLGADPLWIGFAGGASGRELLEGLHSMRIRTCPTVVQQATRVNLEIIDKDGVVTEILEPGATPTPAEKVSFEKTCHDVFAREKQQAIVILSGSLPDGVSQNFYADLIDTAHAYGCRVFLDTGGEALRSALAAAPDFVKPNRQEAERLTGGHIAAGREAAAKALRWLLSAGAKSAAISLGEEGLVWCPGAGQNVYYAHPAEVQVRSTVGCGDAALAAFAYGTSAGWTPEKTLGLAAACGAANCLAGSPGAARAEDIHRLEKEIRVETVV